MLVVAEEVLADGGVVRVLAREDRLDAEPEQALADVGRLVVGGVVEEPVRVLAPVVVLL